MASTADDGEIVSATAPAVQTSNVYVLRGPFIASVAILVLVWPHLTVNVILHITIAWIGFMLFAVDICALGERSLRLKLAGLVDGLVLDDILRAIYDPKKGLIVQRWNVWFANTVGCFSMYSMMDEDQRTELFRSSFQIDRKSAHTVLMTKGGIKWVLGPHLQKWLFNIKTEKDTPQIESMAGKPDIQVETMDEDAAETETVETDSDASEIEAEIVQERSTVEADCDAPLKDTNRSLPKDSEKDAQESEQVAPSPDEAFREIIRTVIRKSIEAYICSIQESSVEKVVSTAASFLFAQLCWRAVFRSKITLMNSVLPALTVGAITGSVGTLVAKDMLQGKLQGIAPGKAMIKKLLQQVKSKDIKRMLALAVLFWIGKHRRKQA